MIRNSHLSATDQTNDAGGGGGGDPAVNKHVHYHETHRVYNRVTDESHIYKCDLLRLTFRLAGAKQLKGLMHVMKHLIWPHTTDDNDEV